MNKKRANNSRKKVQIQEDFLQCIKFLHGEALRLGMIEAAISLEDALYQGVKSIDIKMHPSQYINVMHPEVYFMREFRKLSAEQQKLLIDFIERVEN